MSVLFYSPEMVGCGGEWEIEVDKYPETEEEKLRACHQLVDEMNREQSCFKAVVVDNNTKRKI